MASSVVDVCIIEPDGDDRRAMVHRLEQAGYRVAQAGTAQEGLRLVASARPKVVLCRWTGPGLDGREVLRQIKSQEGGSETFCVLVTDPGDEPDPKESPDPVVDDYLLRPCHPFALQARVRTGLRMWALRRDLKEAALTDGLTGLWTHQHFTAVLETEFARSRRYGSSLSLMMCDLDDFKAINDSFGHQAGNAVLQRTAEVLRRSIRQNDVPVRYGGEEFAVVVPEADLAEAAQMAERLRAQVEKAVRVEAAEGVRVTVSVGVASAGDERVITPEDLVELADRAMYLAKRRGRNRVCTANDLTEDEPEYVQDSEVRELHRQVASLSLRARETYVQGIWALVQALEARDPCTANHSRNVTVYAEAIAVEMRLSESLRRVIRNAAMLHDIGKIGVPDVVLMKRGPLSAEERHLIDRTPLLSARIIDHMRILDAEVAIIRHQREYYDGTGKPAGLSGKEIPLGSRIVLVADAFDSMTTDRAYRRHLTIEQALGELRRGAGRQFDPAVVEAIARAARRFSSEWQNRIAASIREAELVGAGG